MTDRPTTDSPATTVPPGTADPPAPGDPTEQGGGRRRVRWSVWAQRYGALAALVVLLVYNAIATPYFRPRSRCCSSC